MERQQRAQLLLEREETEAKIAALRGALQRAGKVLSSLGAALAASPENTTFANAPPPLGHMPLHLMHSRAFDWNSVPDRTTLAQEIQDLRALQERLQELIRLLGKSGSSHR